MPYVAIMAVTERRESTGCWEGRRALRARRLWGRVTKPKPIDSGGHRLHMGSPSGLIPIFTLLTYCSSFFQETFFTWIAGHQSLLTFTSHSFSASSSDYDLLKPRPWSLDHLPVYTSLFLLNSRPKIIVSCLLESPCDVPIASQTQISCLNLKPASSLVVPVSGHGASFSMVLRPKSLFLFCSDSSLTHQ